MLKIAWAPLYAHPLPEGHRFPMEKYTLIPEQLLYEGTIEQANLFTTGPMDEGIVLLTHEQDYWHKLKNRSLSPKEIRRTGFPLSEALVHREVVIGQGTLEASRHALQDGVSLNVAGGTHHAYPDRGEGFCLLNDFAMAANQLLHEGTVSKILIIDLDVHQGNGTAVIFRNEPRVFTFSMHCEANYPLVKEQSDLDLALPAYTEDGPYLRLLEETLPRLIDEVEPDFAYYLAGADILATDKLGHLKLSREGARQRDKFVFQQLIKNEIPVCVSMGGGYSPAIRDIVEAHCNTFRLAQELYF